MQINFEKNLVKVYLPYLIPNLQQAAFAKEEMGFYYNAKFKKYPAALIFRTDDDSDSFRKVYQFDDDAEPGQPMTTGNYFPYKQSYSIKVFVEKQTEMVRLRDAMRIRYQKDPYVVMPDYRQEKPDFHIGLWLTNLNIEDLRGSYDEKGATRVITFDFEANLVISDLDDVPEITEIDFNINDMDSSEPSTQATLLITEDNFVVHTEDTIYSIEV